MHERVIHFRRAQQSLSRNAPPIETDAAQVRALDNGCPNTKLRGANGGDISARPGTDDEDIERAIGHRSELAGRRASGATGERQAKPRLPSGRIVTSHVAARTQVIVKELIVAVHIRLNGLREFL